MQIIEANQRDNLKHLFTYYQQQPLVNSVLEGHHGIAIADVDKQVAQIVVGKFTFFGGDCRHPLARKFVQKLSKNLLVLNPQPRWHQLLLAVHGKKLQEFQRYTLSSHTLNIDQLHTLRKNISPQFTITQVDMKLAEAMTRAIEPNLTGNFSNTEDFIKRGIGFCALTADQQIACGATSYAICHQGIEVEIDTHPDFRRRGLALSVAAALTSDCLSKNIEPHWDAANFASVKLAEKLGYQYVQAYNVYLLSDIPHV